MVDRGYREAPNDAGLLRAVCKGQQSLRWPKVSAAYHLCAHFLGTDMALSMVYMQIYQTLAHMFRPGAPKFAILSTPRDIVAVHGMLFPMPPFDSEGLRVTIS